MKLLSPVQQVGRGAARRRPRLLRFSPDQVGHAHPHPATNFHTENIQQFAGDVDKATAGKLKITVHPNGALFKANEIKRAVQGGQAQVGEIIISGLQRRPAFRARHHSLPCQQLRRVEGCTGAESRSRRNSQAGPEGPVLRAVAAAGHLPKTPLNSRLT